MDDERPRAAPPPVLQVTPGVQPGWYPDPLQRFEFRYHNGQRWTPDVSNSGQRFIDPLGVEPTPPNVVAHRPLPPHVAAVVPSGWMLPSPPPRHPARTMSVLSLVFGIVGVVLAIVPFLFVVGAGAAVAALVLGISALKRARLADRPEPAIRGRSIAGIALAPLSLGLCVLGFQFTRVTLREVEEYSQPGPYRVEIERCTGEDSFAEVHGTVANQDDRHRSYVLMVEFRTGGRIRGRERIEVDDVPAGEIARWSGGSYLTDLVSDDLTCTLDDVTGPYPFGLEPND